jgi:hypothetical protein
VPTTPKEHIDDINKQIMGLYNHSTDSVVPAARGLCAVAYGLVDVADAIRFHAKMIGNVRRPPSPGCR